MSAVRALSRRVGAIERDSSGGLQTAKERAFEAAFMRLSDALRTALPLSPAVGRREDTGPATYKWVTDIPAVEFDALVTAMHARIVANAQTDEDRRVLASMPAADLQLIGETAVSFVAIYARIFDDY